MSMFRKLINQLIGKQCKTMRKKNVAYLICICLLVLVGLTGCGSAKMEIPDNIEEIISFTINDLTNPNDSEYSLIGTIMDNCEYSVLSTKANHKSVEVEVNVSQGDVYDVLKKMESEQEISDWESLEEDFNKKLKKTERSNRDVTVQIVKEEDSYIAEMDEATADVFLGGYLSYVEESIYNYVKE